MIEITRGSFAPQTVCYALGFTLLLEEFMGTRLSQIVRFAALSVLLCVVACGEGTISVGNGDEENQWSNWESGDGDGESGDRDSGDGEPGDNEPGDNEPGDSEPGDNEPGDNEPGDSDPDPVCTPPSRTPLGTAPTSASWRYGGGTGYPDAVVLDSDCMIVVNDADGLEAALSAAQPGDVVYVADDARIDLTGRGNLCIPGGIWLASGRGHNGSSGGVIHAADAPRPMLKTCGSDIRITGLRLLGNDPNQCPAEYYSGTCPQPDNTGGVNCRDCTRASIGVIVEHHDDVEFDNNEMAGWAHAAIYARNTDNLHVHHNYIHHTQRQGLGYGVVLMRGGTNVVNVLVEWNRFNYNRHAIAGSGEPGQSYVARNNLVLANANGHVFDMHGSNENVGDGSPWAGTNIQVYENTVLVDNHYTMVIRGKPEEGAWLFDNCLRRSGPSTAAQQRHHTGQMYVDQNPSGQSAPNLYDQGLDDCERVRWCYAPGGDGPWTYGAISRRGVENLALHDFNGDGKADVFTTQNGQWRVVYGASGSWQTLNSSSVTLESLRFGDFNGDGKTDVFNATGSLWRVSFGGTSSWQTLRSATETLGQLAFGDFNGDGKTDVFTTHNGQWLVSWGGTSNWEVLNTSGVGLSQLAFGDFNGDGKTDVFRANGSSWTVSWGGTSSWATLNSSGLTTAQLRFGDLNGDGKTDIFRSSNDRWLVSWGGTTGWQELRISSLASSALLFGDVTGDGRVDVFTSGCH